MKQVATSEADQMASILVGSEVVLYMTNRLRTYAKVLQITASSPTRDNLEESIIKFYAHILRFLAQAIEAYQTSAVRRFLKAFGPANDIATFERRANDLAMKVEADANSCSRNFEYDILQQMLTELKPLRKLQASVDQLQLDCDLAKIPIAKGAIFNAADSSHTLCHPLTRIDLLAQIQQWAKRHDSKDIFWLHGAAGAGKSTISWTFAHLLDNDIDRNDALLGASFFFKRGEGDRGNGLRFFPTIVRQLIRKIPGLDVLVANAVREDPFICDKGLGEQFRVLLQQPLQDETLSGNGQKIFVIVVDALDECENEGHIHAILQLWSGLASTSKIRIRLFLTSRPDPPIRLKFKDLSKDLFDNIVLQEAVPQNTIEQDLRHYLKDAFAKIQEHAVLRLSPRLAPPKDWPGDEVLSILVNMSVPLFIVAATVCRYVGDPKFDPTKRLEKVLSYRRTGDMAQMEMSYLPVLSYLTVTTRNALEREDMEELRQEFRTIVGSIVCLVEPLSLTDLAALLERSETSVLQHLDRVHAVMCVPEDITSPIRPLHLSFSEFLISEQSRGQPYSVDSPQTHSFLMEHCLALLSGRDGLRENVFDLQIPGYLRQELDSALITQKLSPAFQYACRYWAHHLEQSLRSIKDNDVVHNFLKTHYLHWLEALSFISRLSDSIGLLRVLRSVASSTNSAQLLLFLEDARRFVLANRYIADLAPLQLYSSAIVFAPQDSMVREVCAEVPAWVAQSPTTPDTWGPELLKLESHRNTITALAFSRDDSLLASAAEDDDYAIILWNSSTGTEIQKLLGHSWFVNALAFSHDNSMLASESLDKTARVWQTSTGHQLRAFSAHGHTRCIVWANHKSLLALHVGSGVIQLVDTRTGCELERFAGHGSDKLSFTFSQDDSHLICAGSDGNVRFWNTANGQETRRINVSHNPATGFLIVCPTAALLASTTPDLISLFEISTGRRIHEHSCRGWSHRPASLSPDGSLLAFDSFEGVQMTKTSLDDWDPVVLQQSLFNATLQFSHRSLLLAFGGDHGTMQLLDTSVKRRPRTLVAVFDKVRAISRNGSLIATASFGSNIRLWKSSTARATHDLKQRSAGPIQFSPDSMKLIALLNGDCRIGIWNAVSGHQLHIIEGRSSFTWRMAVSHDGSMAAFASIKEMEVAIFDVSTGKELLGLKHDHSRTSIPAFGDGSSLVTIHATVDRPAFRNEPPHDPDDAAEAVARLWDLSTGQETQTLRYKATKRFPQSGQVAALGHRNPSLLAFICHSTLLLWNLATNEGKEMEHSLHVKEARFTPDDSALITDRGTLDIHPTHISPVSVHRISCIDLAIEGEWVTYDGKRILWLPQEYRVGAAVHEDMVFLGEFDDDQLAILRIEPSLLPFRKSSAS